MRVVAPVAAAAVVSYFIKTWNSPIYLQRPHRNHLQGDHVNLPAYQQDFELGYYAAGSCHHAFHS